MAKIEKETQANKVLNYLKKGRSLTSLTALKYLGIISFPKRICEIISMGYKIDKKRIAVINRFGDRVYINKYNLNQQHFYKPKTKQLQPTNIN